MNEEKVAGALEGAGDELTEAGIVRNLALAVGLPSEFDPSKPQAVIVPAGASLELPDLSAWRETPVRKTGTYRPATVEAFIAYVKDQLRADETTVWVHPVSGNVVAVLDDHGSGPGYGQHRAVLKLTATEEWTYWANLDGKMVPQDDFAEHIEGGLEEIVTPDSAEMLEIAQSFHATIGASFRQSKRLSSGEQQLQYDEQVTASAGAKADLTVPTTILLAIAPFYGEDRYKITARLRFRLSSGRLTLGYLLDRPSAVQRDALEGIATKIQDEFPRTFIGEPSS